MWTASLEAEERDRLESLRARINEFQTEERPTHRQINALLVSAVQAQITLMRMSRVFPKSSSTKYINLISAKSHGPTAALAFELHRCWKVLGVSEPTLKVLLRQAVTAVGKKTRSARLALFVDLKPGVRHGVDPEACMRFMAEGKS